MKRIRSKVGYGGGPAAPRELRRRISPAVWRGPGRSGWIAGIDGAEPGRLRAARKFRRRQLDMLAGFSGNRWRCAARRATSHLALLRRTTARSKQKSASTSRRATPAAALADADVSRKRPDGRRPPGRRVPGRRRAWRAARRRTAGPDARTSRHGGQAPTKTADAEPRYLTPARLVDGWQLPYAILATAAKNEGFHQDRRLHYDRRSFTGETRPSVTDRGLTRQRHVARGMLPGGLTRLDTAA